MEWYAYNPICTLGLSAAGYGFPDFETESQGHTVRHRKYELQLFVGVQSAYRSWLLWEDNPGVWIPG